jgi:hypothetical protein
MNEKPALVIAAALIALAMLTTPVLAVPGSTIKAVGKADGTLVTPMGEMPDTIVIQLNAKRNGETYSGSGSLHGINCGATFFFDALAVTFVEGEDKIIFEGVVTGSNTPTSIFVDLGTAIVFETTSSGDSMTLTINVQGYPIFTTNTGSGKVVL